MPSPTSRATTTQTRWRLLVCGGVFACIFLRGCPACSAATAQTRWGRRGGNVRGALSGGRPALKKERMNEYALGVG